jgi:hypothetical protein
VKANLAKGKCRPTACLVLRDSHGFSLSWSGLNFGLLQTRNSKAIHIDPYLTTCQIHFSDPRNAFTRQQKAVDAEAHQGVINP